MAYTDSEIEKVFNYVCEEIEKGRPLRRVLNDENMPSTKIFFKWLENDELKVKRYARACEVRSDIIFDEMFDIADDQEDDIIIVDGKEIVNHNVINRARLRIDTRKWALAKMNPKKYGEKIDITTDNKPITKELTQEEFEEKLRKAKDILDG